MGVWPAARSNGLLRAGAPPRRTCAHLPRSGGRLAGQGGFDHVLDVAHVQAVAGRPFAVDVDHQLRQLAQAVHLGALYALDLLELVLHGLDQAAQLAQVVTRHLDHDLALDLRDGLEHVVADRLRERRVHAGDHGQALVHFFDQLLVREAFAPLFGGLHVHKYLGHAQCLRVSTVFRLAGLGHHGAHFGDGQQGLAGHAQHVGCFVLRHAGRHVPVHPKRAFVELRQKLRAQTGRG